MLAERVTQWTENWKMDGRMEGRMEGRLEGQAAMLQLLLLQRFGNILDQDIQERLRDARPEQLEAWARRILDARSIGEVFAEDEDNIIAKQ